MRASWFCADLREPWLTTTSAASKKKEQQSAPNVAHRLVGSNGALEALQVDFWPSTLSLPQASLEAIPRMPVAQAHTHTHASRLRSVADQPNTSMLYYSQNAFGTSQCLTSSERCQGLPQVLGRRRGDYYPRALSSLARLASKHSSSADTRCRRTLSPPR